MANTDKNGSARNAIRKIEDRLHEELGFKRLNPVWAKLEIFLGLPVLFLGLLCGMWAATHTSDETALTAACIGALLFTLGGHLAMAGHRSHGYQFRNTQTAYVVWKLGKDRDLPQDYYPWDEEL